MACVFLRKGLNTWTAKIKDHRGRWVQVPTVAATKAEARRLAEDLERFHTEVLMRLPGVMRSNSMLVLRTVKKTTGLALTDL